MSVQPPPFSQSPKQALVLDSLKAFGKTFRFEKPVPVDIIPILTNDPQKQKDILERNANILNNKEKEEELQLANHANNLEIKQTITKDER